VERRSLLLPALLLALTGLTAVNLVGLMAVGHSLRPVSEAQSQLIARLQQVERKTEPLAPLQAQLTQADGERTALTAELAKAKETLTRLSTDLARLSQDVGTLQIRLRELQDKTPAGAAPARPDLAQEQRRYLDSWVERVKKDPAIAPLAARRAFGVKGVAGLGAVLGLDEPDQARLERVYGDFAARLKALEKAHSTVAVEGGSVRVYLRAFPVQGQALRDEWHKALAGLLTPEQQRLYKRAEMDAILFERGFGACDLSIVATRQGNALRIERKGQKPDGGGAFQNTVTIAGEGAIETFPDRHLLTDEALARLR